MEGRILAQLEGAGHAVGRNLPAFGEFRRQRCAVVGRRAVLHRLRGIAQEPVVAIPGQTVDCLVGAHAVHVETVGPKFLHNQKRIRALGEHGASGKWQRGGRPQQSHQNLPTVEIECGM
jgi:hypothetical protein